MVITVEILFSIGTIVYLKTDIDQYPRLVVAYSVDQKDVMYELIAGTLVSKHYAFEMSEEKEVLV